MKCINLLWLQWIIQTCEFLVKKLRRANRGRAACIPNDRGMNYAWRRNLRNENSKTTAKFIQENHLKSYCNRDWPREVSIKTCSIHHSQINRFSFPFKLNVILSYILTDKYFLLFRKKTIASTIMTLNLKGGPHLFLWLCTLLQCGHIKGMLVRANFTASPP